MTPALAVQIETPTKVHLNGLWFGSQKAKRVFIFVHGLTGTAFSMASLRDALVDKNTAVLTFDNRGFSQISTVKKGHGKNGQYLLAGTAHERFEDSADDVEGAVHLARKMGAKELYFVGHSTGANKVVYWAAQKKSRIHGVILLGPLSDYAGIVKSFGRKKLQKSVSYAKKMVSQGKPHDLMPKNLREWFECDAQRFLSLYTPDSKEETFPYAQEGKIPTLLAKLRVPVFVFLAGKDEYADVPTIVLEKWFTRWLYTGEVRTIKNVAHSFKGGERQIVEDLRTLIAEL